jgi:hypothetical protein
MVWVCQDFQSSTLIHAASSWAPTAAGIVGQIMLSSVVLSLLTVELLILVDIFPTKIKVASFQLEKLVSNYFNQPNPMSHNIINLFVNTKYLKIL